MPPRLSLLLLPMLALGCIVQVSPPTPILPALARTGERPMPTPAARIVDLQYGGSFCALREDGHVACWGQNASGSLGDGTNEARSRPALVPGVDHVRQLLGLPPEGFCALRADASLWCWGFADTGGLSLPAANSGPQVIAERVRDFGFAERWRGVCARRDDGTTACTELRASSGSDCAYWADDARSSCLFKTTVVSKISRPLAEAGHVRFGQQPIPFSRNETCVVERGVVLCQGDNLEGELGDPTRVRADAPAAVPGLRDVVSLTDNGASACAVRADGAAFCWGRNTEGELIVPPDPHLCPTLNPPGVACNRAPTALPVADVAQVLLTIPGMFVLTRSGVVLKSRPAAQSSSGARRIFDLVPGIPPSVRLVRGYVEPYATCALTRAGEVYCFGHGADLGDGSLLVSRVPMPIPGIRDAVEVEVNITGACARLADGTVTCWGDPEAPHGLRDIGGMGQPCALARDGRVWCWGTNSYGEMGLGRRERPGLSQNREIAHVPLPVPGLRNIIAISSTLGTTCALDKKGIVRCWGTWGPVFPTLSPTEIRGLPPAREVWSAKSRQCALTRDGQVWCWEAGSKPIPEPDLGAAAHLPGHGPGAFGERQACIIRSDSTVRCTGMPAPIPDLGRVKQISLAPERVSGISRACAVLENGDVVCWGGHYCADRAALCTRDTWNHSEKMLTDVTQVSVGFHLACAVGTDGTVWCWGRTDGGGLGGTYPPAERVARVDLGHLDR